MCRAVTVSVVIMLLVFVVPGSGVAKGYLPSQGTKQVIFGFSGWSLEDYEGGIGLRSYLRDDVALRMGLDLGFAAKEEEVYSGDYSRHLGSIRPSLVMEHYLSSFRNVSPFLGFGLAYRYTWEDSEWLSKGDCVQRPERESSNHTLAAMALLGVQWYFTDGIGLGAEYALTFDFSWKDTDEYRCDGGLKRYDAFVYELAVGAGQLYISISL